MIFERLIQKNHRQTSCGVLTLRCVVMCRVIPVIVSVDFSVVSSTPPLHCDDSRWCMPMGSDSTFRLHRSSHVRIGSVKTESRQRFKARRQPEHRRTSRIQTPIVCEVRRRSAKCEACLSTRIPRQQRIAGLKELMRGSVVVVGT